MFAESSFQEEKVDNKPAFFSAPAHDEIDDKLALINSKDITIH